MLRGRDRQGAFVSRCDSLRLLAGCPQKPANVANWLIESRPIQRTGDIWVSRTTPTVARRGLSPHRATPSVLTSALSPVLRGYEVVVHLGRDRQLLAIDRVVAR